MYTHVVPDSGLWHAVMGNRNRLKPALSMMVFFSLSLNVYMRFVFQAGKWIKVDGKQLLNFTSHNYLNLIEEERVNNRAKDAIHKYGVGSCGPRGFYGTVGAT